MAALTGAQVRLEQRLKVKLGEAKNLSPRSHGSVGVRDVYCVLSLDQEQIFRSATIEKTLDPFFGEEFQFDIPREFRFLCVYVYDRDRPMKTDKIVGKVSIKREDLSKQNGKDQWLAITPVDADSEVQGKVHVRIQLKSLRHMNDAAPQPMVEVKIEECSDLCIVNGSCDPYAQVTMHYSNKKQENKRTKTRKKTVAPHFDETFFFESPGGRHHSGDGSCTYNVGGGAVNGNSLYSEEVAGFQCLQVVLWHESAGMFGNVFLGELRIPLQGLTAGREMNAWYLLQPREGAGVRHSSGSNSSKSCGLGSLRLNIHYSCVHVFPSPLYDSLRSLLVQTATVQPVSASVGWLVGEICGNNKQEAAVPLIRVLLQHNQAVAFIANLASHEMQHVSDPNTIFRGNTLASKCMDELMKLAGHHYLKQTLKPVIDQVIREKKPCEVDPARIPPTENRETNLANLCEYTNAILRCINNSALSCPPVMCQLFSELRENADVHFPNQREVRYSVISGFIFLRFFVPAILGPKLFDITSEQIDLGTVRTLTLISKTVQGVGNLVSSRNLHHTCKEEYMREVFSLCTNNKLVDAARTFLEIISSIPNGNLKAYDTPITLREGVMIKRAQGRKKFGLKNFKTRFFRLNTRSLTYAKSKGSGPLCIIPVEDILAVEPVQESSFKCKNMFQLVQPNRTLYIQAANCVEEKEWLDLLTKVCQYNKHRLKQYHPGAYLNSHWLCCKATSENAEGCSAVSNYLDEDLNIQIDAEREVECILGLLLANQHKLKSLLELCSDESPVVGDCKLEDPNATRACIKKLVDAITTLQQHHVAHCNALRNTNRPGSKQAPIGDDNYLMLTSNFGYEESVIWDTGQQHDPNAGRQNPTTSDGETQLRNLTTNATATTGALTLHDANSLKNVNNSSNLTISNIRDSIKKNANNNIKRLLNTKANHTIRSDNQGQFFSGSEPASKIVSESNELSDSPRALVPSLSGCVAPALATCVSPALACCASTAVTTSCITTSRVASSLTCSVTPNCEGVCKSNSNFETFHATNSETDQVNVTPPQSQRSEVGSNNKRSNDAVEQCLGTIADAVKSSAEFLHKAERNVGNSNDDSQSGVLLAKFKLTKQNSLENAGNNNYSSYSRSYSDYSNCSLPRPSTMTRRSTQTHLDSSRRSPDYVNISSFSHDCSDLTTILADDMDLDPMVNAPGENGSEAMEVSSDEANKHLSRPTSIQGAASNDGSVLYATGVDQSCRTTFQQVTSDLKLPGSQTPLRENLKFGTSPLNSLVCSSQSSSDGSCVNEDARTAQHTPLTTQDKWHADTFVLSDNKFQLAANVTHRQETLDNRLNGNVQRFSI
ncbi:ras GTPase-activating protein 3 [Hyalella azteca]|uniref:Ras GTPase-activating protein 3 n=1 Tax=Hyalella azteca TaxID=294128 RepID=A0A8B7MYH4_HYAAZ|nr:ras GTPase-activating protein 3 [Hyalella azteca]